MVMKKAVWFYPVLLMVSIFFFGACGEESNDLMEEDNTPNYTVTGRVLESGSGLSGVSVSLTGTGKDIASMTDSTGSYSFSNIPDGEYIAFPSKNSYTMNPSKQSFSVAAGNISIPDFIATKAENTFTLSGRVLENNAGILGVTVRLTGALTDTIATTSSTGAYYFTGLPDGIYTLTPSKTDYIFTPPNQHATVSSDIAVPDFTAKNVSIPPPQTIQGITFVFIPGNTFQMGQTGFAEPVHTVTVNSFLMSETEITNAQYCFYLNASLAAGDIIATSSIVKGNKGSYSGQNYIYLSDIFDVNIRSWITFSNDEFSVVSGHENWPVVSVTWYGSKAFAEYYGWDLAREAEWEYACGGGRQYEYGTDNGKINKDKANYWNNGPSHQVDVKSYPKNPFGLYDMSGNVWEWCSDWYGSYSPLPAIDPHGPEIGSNRVIRGGGWSGVQFYCWSTYRDSDIPPVRHYAFGFRVVRR
jgi:formylglycine-generating enzyme required for sulfatase activity